MLVATCNRLFQIGSETRTIEIDDSILRRYASDTERDRESYTEVLDVCLSRPIILDVQACLILTMAHLNRGTSSEPIPLGVAIAMTCSVSIQLTELIQHSGTVEHQACRSRSIHDRGLGCLSQLTELIQYMRQ